ncbi:YdaU family protein [Bordetella bronchiseptica]|uniref:YdaU family protein n=1 Tax=Bordetella bronchiseptica TaxID=518 RepID=UPI003F746BF3
MHFYPHNIGDHVKDTRHLTLLEEGAYRRLLDHYYTIEKALPLDEADLCRKLLARSDDERKAVGVVLREFFVQTESGWWHKRCEEEIAAGNKRRDQSRENGKKGGRPRKSVPPQELPGGDGGPDTGNPDETQRVIGGLALGSGSRPGDGLESAQVDGLPPCPHERLVEIYHDRMPLNPRIKVLDDGRRKLLAARWKQAARLDVPPFGYHTIQQGLDAWHTFFEICSESDFLTGQAPPSEPGRPPFVASLDFLISPDGFRKCVENHYHRE